MMLWAALGAAFLIACAPTRHYETGPGPHAVSVTDTAIHDPCRSRDIRLRVAAPAAAGPYPVVVFSHGAFCDPQNYARVTDHWASHGYVVIAPHHLDSPGNGERLRADQASMLMESRIQDLTVVMDMLPRLSAQGSGSPDTARAAIAGHSFGAMLAMIKVGLLLEDPVGGAPVSRADPRFRAAVVISGVGPMPQMAENAFDGLTGPLFASGGTRDEGNVGTGEIFPWQWRMAPYDLAPAGDKYSLVIENADHYLGGLICREDRGGADDFEGVQILTALSLAFLEAYVRDDPAARRFMDRVDVAALTAGRARFERK
jgi:predicted dienelactone hydrolase